MAAETALEIAPPMATFSRPLVYRHFLVNNYDDQVEQELQIINQECSKAMVPIIDHKYDHQVPRFLIPLFNDDGPWEIKKVLTKSDVNGLCRLLLSHQIVEKYIFSYWNSRLVQWLKEDEYSVKVSFRDFETYKVHQLVFRKWKSNNSYVFQTGWSKLVKALKLEAGDEIGMFWNSKSNFFVFKLLKKHASTVTPLSIEAGDGFFKLLKKDASTVTPRSIKAGDGVMKFHQFL